MGSSNINVKYNIRLESLSEVKPETLVDSAGRLQSDHNRLNEISRNKLDIVEKIARGNQVKISEVEKLTIKQQTEIDFIKSTPTNFDLARVELFQNLFGTAKPGIYDGVKNADILTDLYEPRSDGNFEFGVLKNPRAKFIGAVDKAVNLNSLFGNRVHDISYGERTNSIWIVTSDGPGERGYLFRCSVEFIDGQLNVLSYWQLDALGANLEHVGVCESHFRGVTTIFVGVSDTSGTGAHYLNRYRINFNRRENLVTIADGKESSPLVPIYKGNGEILDGEVTSSIADLNVEKIDISESGILAGIEVVNEYLYILIRSDDLASEEEIDSTGYSLIRRVTITEFGVLTSGTNTFKYKLDDIFETKLNKNASSTRWNVYGISTVRSSNLLSVLEDVDQDDLDTVFENSQTRNLFYLSAQQETTNKKKIVMIDLQYADVSTANPNYDKGFQNINTVLKEIDGISSVKTNPFITTLMDQTILEVYEKTTTVDRRFIAIHDICSYDVFQGNILESYKVKRYFNTENFHAQLGVNVSSVSVNQTQAITAGPDNEFQFTTAGGSRSRLTSGVGSVLTFDVDNGSNLFHLCPFVNGKPYWAKPSKTFAVTDGVDNPISGIISISWEGSPVSGDALYVSYLNSTRDISLLKVEATDINNASAQIGADGFTQYDIINGASQTVTAGKAGSFNGHVSYDPVTSKLWVSTSQGFIHNITDGGATLDFTDNTYKVLKAYGSTVSGEIVDGTEITGLSVYDNKAYVSCNIPNVNGDQPDNTVVRVFDIDRSTSTQPLSSSIFVTKGNVTDISISDTGLYVAKNDSIVDKVADSQFGNSVFESTEVIDEFNFFKNPALNNDTNSPLGFYVDDTTYIEKEKSSDTFIRKEWILPRRAMAFALHNENSNTIYPAKLQIIDYSDIDNPINWTEFVVSTITGTDADTNPGATGRSGAILHGAGQIDAVTYIDDKVFVGRRDYGIGTTINVIDFANDSATLIVDPIHGQGSLYSGMQFGYKNNETDKTGGLNERNNPGFHYSGFVNPNVKVGPNQILSMSSELLTNKTDQNILTPYVIVGRYVPDGYTSGSVDIINGNTLESVIGIGPGAGSANKVVINPDGSAFVGTHSGEIYKIEDVRIVNNDGDDYVSDFNAQVIKVFYPDNGMADSLTDMKVRHFTDTLGNKRNIVYASYNEGSGNPSYAVKFIYEDVAGAGGSTAGEFLNNAEVIYYEAAANNGVNAIDYMDDRIFLGFEDPNNGFRLTVLKKFNFKLENNYPYSNNWTPILGGNGAVSNHIDYNDLNYNGIKSPIKKLNSVSKSSLLFAETENGSVLFKFPFVVSSKWFSTTKAIGPEINAVALARDVFIEDGSVTEFIDRKDTRIKFEGNWTDSNPSVVVPFTSPLFNKPDNRKQMRGKLTVNGSAIDADSYLDYDPFIEAIEEGIEIFLDNQNVSDLGFDFSENILKQHVDNSVFVFDLLEINNGVVGLKQIYQDTPIAYISLNDINTTALFFETDVNEFDNINQNSFGQFIKNFDLFQQPVVVIQTLDGRPISTFQEASSTGESSDSEQMIKADLASTQKLITDKEGNPVDTLIISGIKEKNEGKFVKKLEITTFNFGIKEKL